MPQPVIQTSRIPPALPVVAEVIPQPVVQVSSISPPVQQGRNVAPFLAPVTIENIEKLAVRHTLTGHTGGVLSVAISPDSTILVSGSWDHTIKIWNLSTGKEIRTLSDHTDEVWSVAISPDGATLVSSSDDKTIKVWRT
ncbi:MAG TPA: hypothetical protein VGN34_00465 [Ktedonobacteraceae bacterium]|jgi:WD40 repeat protein